MDSITLNNIETWTRIGVPDAERSHPQRLLVSLELFCSLKLVAASDDLSKGIDYQVVTDAILELGKSERKTAERFAEDIATMLLAKFKPAGGVRVSIQKKPPLPLEAACITITRP